MNILHLTGAKSWGGNEQQLIDTCIEFKKLNITNYIYCYKESLIEKEAIKNNISVINSISSKSFSLKKGKHLKKQLLILNIDIIHLHTSDSVTTYVMSDMLFRLKTPAVFSKKGMNSKIKRGLSSFKYNYKKIKQIICVSNAVLSSFKETLKPKNHHKLTIIYDGINLRRIRQSEKKLKRLYNIDNNKTIVGNIANHSKAKDLVTFVKTAHYLINTLNMQNVIFLQIGKNSKYTQELLLLTKEYKLEEHIIFTGFLENASSYINQFDIYLMTSEREGLGVSILESFYQKTPVISTVAGGIPEIVTHDFNGKLSDIRDYKSLANNIVLLMKQPELMKSFCYESYQLVLKKFTTKQLAKNTLISYKKALE